MASTYTTNLGIEKPATGDQAGSWGDTVNTNFDLVDEAVNGIVAITLGSAGTSGSPNDLPITNAASSTGRNAYIEFTDGGDLGAAVYVQLTPNDAEKIVHVYNNLSGSRDLYLFQGTYSASRDYVLGPGRTRLLKFSGGGAASSTVTEVTETVREVLTANRTYYVRTDGSDSNNGLANSAAGAFLTIQKGLDVTATLDLNNYVVTIQVADGTYSESVGVPQFTGADNSVNNVILLGNTTTPASCIISTAGDCLSPYSASYITIKGFKLVSSGSNGLLVGYNSIVSIYEMDFGACSAAQIACYDGGRVYVQANYTISGSATTHVDSWGAGGHISGSGKTITLTGTPAFSSAFAKAGLVGVVNYTSMTFSGSATGSRYNAYDNGVIQTDGGGASYFPGNSAGATSNGGQYL